MVFGVGRKSIKIYYSTWYVFNFGQVFPFFETQMLLEVVRNTQLKF